MEMVTTTRVVKIAPPSQQVVPWSSVRRNGEDKRQCHASLSSFSSLSSCSRRQFLSLSSFVCSNRPQTQPKLHSKPRISHGFSLQACLPSSSSPKTTSNASTKLYVCGLSFRTTEEGLRNAFKNFGELVEVNLVMDRIANRPRGFAFLRYAIEEESKKAIEGMHGKFLDGRVIFVEVAKPRSELRRELNQN